MESQVIAVELIRIMEYSRHCSKFYRCQEIVCPVPFLKKLRDAGLAFDRVSMKRDAEMDMQFGAGDYTLEALEASGPFPDNGDACLFTVKTWIDGVPVEIQFSDDSDIVYLVTPKRDLDLAFIERE